MSMFTRQSKRLMHKKVTHSLSVSQSVCLFLSIYWSKNPSRSTEDHLLIQVYQVSGDSVTLLWRCVVISIMWISHYSRTETDCPDLPQTCQNRHASYCIYFTCTFCTQWECVCMSICRSLAWSRCLILCLFDERKLSSMDDVASTHQILHHMTHVSTTDYMTHLHSPHHILYLYHHSWLSCSGKGPKPGGSDFWNPVLHCARHTNIVRRHGILPTVAWIRIPAWVAIFMFFRQTPWRKEFC